MKSRNTNWRKAAKAFSIFTLLLVLIFSFSSVAFAGISIEGDPDITIDADRVIEDDLFLVGRDILVAGTIKGDLFVSGETVSITGTVEGNLFTTGGEINISGKIDGAVVVAGGYSAILQNGAMVTRNIYFSGYNLEIQENTTVQRSIYAAGYQVQIDGQVDRNVIAGTGAFVLTGSVAGDVLLEVGHPSSSIPNFYIGQPYQVDQIKPGMYLDEDLIGGELDYHYSYFESDFDFDFDIDQFTTEAASFIFAQQFRRRAGEFLAIVFLGALLLYWRKETVAKAVEEIKSNALRDTGAGLLIFLLYIPAVLVLFLAMTMIVVVGSVLTLGGFTSQLISFTGLTFTGILAVFGLLVTFGTKIVFSYLVGRWVLSKGSQTSTDNYWMHFGALALGAFFYELVRVVPILGWLFVAIVATIGIGAFFFMLLDKLNTKKTEVTPA
jgi:cytoskeletal protein CcmA (bactofilin family)